MKILSPRRDLLLSFLVEKTIAEVFRGLLMRELSFSTSILGKRMYLIQIRQVWNCCKDCARKIILICVVYI